MPIGPTDPINTADINEIRVGVLGRTVDDSNPHWTTGGAAPGRNALSVSSGEKIITRAINALDVLVGNTTAATRGFGDRFNVVIGDEEGLDQAAFDSIGTNLIQAVAAISGSARFEHTQALAATNWTVSHNMAQKYVIAQVVDLSGNTVIPDIDWPASTATELKLVFANAKAGTCIVRR